LQVIRIREVYWEKEKENIRVILGKGNMKVSNNKGKKKYTRKRKNRSV